MSLKDNFEGEREKNFEIFQFANKLSVRRNFFIKLDFWNGDEIICEGRVSNGTNRIIATISNVLLVQVTFLFMATLVLNRLSILTAISLHSATG